MLWMSILVSGGANNMAKEGIDPLLNIFFISSHNCVYFQKIIKNIFLLIFFLILSPTPQ
jgi:hypothetical protein